MSAPADVECSRWACRCSTSVYLPNLCAGVLDRVSLLVCACSVLVCVHPHVHAVINFSCQPHLRPHLFWTSFTMVLQPCFPPETILLKLITLVFLDPPRNNQPDACPCSSLQLCVCLTCFLLVPSSIPEGRHGPGRSAELNSTLSFPSPPADAWKFSVNLLPTGLGWYRDWFPTKTPSASHWASTIPTGNLMWSMAFEGLFAPGSSQSLNWPLPTFA